MPRPHTRPVPTDDAELHRQAARRRAALVAGGCATYQLGYNAGNLAIVCMCCGLGSTNFNDIDQRYCGFCQAWHSEWKEQP